MKILISGHKGYIGSRVFKKLAKTEHEVLTLDGNILLATLPDADIVLHLGAYTSVFESWDRPVDYMENIRTTVKIVHAYAKSKLILASSCVNRDPQSSPYAFSKRAAEDYMKLYHPNWTNLVFSNIFGDSPRSVIDKFRNGKEVAIWGDGLQVRDYVHVDDLVEAICQSIDWPNGEYSLGSGKGTTVLELAQATGKQIKYEPAVKEQREAVIPNTSLGWIPKINPLEYVCS